MAATKEKVGIRLDTRAVVRPVEPATALGPPTCPGCNLLVKFRARHRDHKVVANVYRGRRGQRRWDRVEHWHEVCYRNAGHPHGEPQGQEERA